MGVAGGPDLIQDGLVLDLDASDRNSYVSGSTTWFDLSGLNNSGSLTNGPTFNTGSLGSIVFDGVDDYINFNTSPTNVVTVNVWINLNTSGNFPIILAGNNTQYNSGVWDWSLFVYSGLFYIRGNNGDFGDINTPASTLVNTWTNWTLVRNDGNNVCRAYKNGILFGTSTEVSSVNSTLSIGKGGNYYNGRMASTQIYNRALSALEVLQNYNATKTRFGL